MRLKADLTLLLASLVWGLGFIAQRTAAVGIGALPFNAVRWLLGALVMLPFLRFRLPFNRTTLPWMLLGGLLLFGGSGLQQAGLAYTTAGNAGFITSAYVVLVPILIAIFWKQRIPWVIWVAVLMTGTGIYLLSAGGPLKLNPGDGLELIGSFVWAFHVIVTGMAVKKMDVLPFVVGQYLVCAFLNFVFGFIFQPASFALLPSAWIAILYLAVFSTAIGFTLQAQGQKHAPPADASIILSMESVFSALAGWIFLQEDLVPLQILGCALILASILLSQLLPGRLGAKPAETP